MGNKKQKSIEQLLKRPSVNIEDLLDLDSVLTRARGGDPTLLSYLSQPSTIHELLSVITRPYTCREKGIRYPFMSCELLVLISASCIDALATDFGLLEVIWSYLASVPKIESPIMVYITRILSSMLSISPKIVLSAFHERGEILELFIKHLSNTPAADFLCRLIEMESPNVHMLAWLSEEGFFPCIMQTIEKGQGEEAHFALGQFIGGLLMRSFPDNYPLSSLLHRFVDPVVMGPFLDAILESGSVLSSWCQGIEVLSALCERIHQINEPPGSAAGVAAELTATLLPRLQLFFNALDGSEDTYKGPNGPVARLGMKRIWTTRLFADTVLLRSQDIIAELRCLHLTERLFDLFFQHSQNTFLHNNVVEYFTHLCQGDWSCNRLVILEDGLRASKLLSRITKAQRIADSLAELPRRPRPNFMGHITLLADQIHILLDKHGAELYREAGDLLRRETWIEYSNKSYRETKLRDAFVLGGEQAPLQPVATEEVYASVYNSAADESLVRYFCHEIISSFPPGLHLMDLDDIMAIDGDDLVVQDDDMLVDEDFEPNPQSILGGTLFGNRGVGFENIMSMELELHMTALDDDDFDLGPDSDEDENLL